VVFNDQIRPPTKVQKEEKLSILNTYAFTINQVPHVFGEYCFAGHKHKYMEKFTERRFPTLIRSKEQGRRPSTRLKLGKAPPRSDPCPAHSPPHEGGGEGTWSGGERPPCRRLSATPCSSGGMPPCRGGVARSSYQESPPAPPSSLYK